MIALCLASTLSFAGNIPESFDTRPVLPTVNELRNINWTWSSLSKLPNTTKLERDMENKGRYMMTQTIRDRNPNTTITFYGSKQSPEVAVIESRTWGAGNTQESLFVRLDKLKGNIPLKSNCNFKDVSVSEKNKDSDGYSYETGAFLNFQKAYILPKNISSLSAATNDLYIASSQVETYVITGTYQTQAYTLSIVTPEKSKLGQLMNRYGWEVNNKGKKVKCSVS